jgi:hypothetical protein
MLTTKADDDCIATEVQADSAEQIYASERVYSTTEIIRFPA